MKIWGVALAAVGMLMAAPCPVLSAESAKSIQLSKVVMDTAGGIKGKIKGGTLCVFPSKWKIDGNQKTQDYERYDRLFSEKMKALGYLTVTTSGDLFASEDTSRGDFLIAATIRPDTINLCSSVNGEKGNATLNVEWQIFDRAARKVVSTVSTSGYGVQEKFSRTGLTAMLDQAFVASLDALIAQGGLKAYLGAANVQVPSPPAPAGD